MKKIFEISRVSTVGEGFVEGEDAGVKWRVFGGGDRGKESPTFRNQLSHPPHRWLPYPAFTAHDHKGIFLLPLIPFLHNPSPLPTLSRLPFPWVNNRISPSLKDRLKRQKSFLGLVLVKWSAEKKKKKKRWGSHFNLSSKMLWAPYAWHWFCSLCFPVPLRLKVPQNTFSTYGSQKIGMIQSPGILNSFGGNTPQSKSHECEFIALSHSLDAKMVRLSPGGTKHVKKIAKS